MSQKKEPDNERFLDLLPALTLLVLVAIFSLQALSSSGNQSKDSRHHEVSLAEQHLPQIGRVAAFDLIERSKKRVTQKQLEGKIWLANFIFTSCTAECPLMNIEMQKIQAAFATANDLTLVSFTVDPEVDTPEVLSAYADRLSASEQWLFITGERDTLHHLAIDSFKLPVQDLQPQTAHSEHNHHQHQGASQEVTSAPFIHSQKFVLVDQNLNIRGYYDSTDAEALDKLIKQDIPELLEQL